VSATLSAFGEARDLNRRSVAEFLDRARRVDLAGWSRSPASDRWSPAQITEHVALAYEHTRGLLSGDRQSGLPRLLRPVVRFFYVRPVLRTGKFPPRGKAPPPFRPTGSPAPADSLCQRLETAARGLETDLERLLAEGRDSLEHPIFGRVPSSDVLRFQAYHTAHHRQQLPA
jgi:hypothetical protein